MTKVDVLVLTIFFPLSIVFAQRGFPPHPGFGRDNPEIRKQLEQVKIWQMTKELNLPTEKAEKFFPLYNNYTTELRDIAAQRREAVHELDSSIQKEADEMEIKKRVQEVLRLDAQIANVHQKFMQSLESVLSPVEVGKYIVFEQKFDREIRDRIRLIIRQRMKGNAGGPY
jgi:Spy/CpxP family protein refolding chaperone